MFTRSAVTAAAWSLFAIMPVASDLPTQYLPIHGGGGGSGYTRSCGAGRVMTGVVYRAGMLIDAVGIKCRPVAANGTLGTESSSGTLAGGTGGTSMDRSCGTGQVVTELKVYYGSYINDFSFWCQTWNASTRTFSGTKAAHHVGPDSFPDKNATTRCESNAQPVNGIRGRASAVLDAMGIFCNEP